LATLKLLARPGTYSALEAKGKKLEEGFARILTKYSIRGTINRIGSMMTLFFGLERPGTLTMPENVTANDSPDTFASMLRRGIYLPPAPFEAMFVSLAHTTADIDSTVASFHDWAARETRR
jgi:glutamate-1-semialdehyde 2,1-aminomutase